jgi:sporulation protein YlmC with PRC-barrel domain
MEFCYSGLKQKDVITVGEGKNLGKVCDLTFSFPENFIIGLTVTGCRGFKFNRQEIFIPISNVRKIGQDAILVNISPPDSGGSVPPPPKKSCSGEKNNCLSSPLQNGAPFNCPPDMCQPRDSRRSYDEYE